jgi:hemolysin III
MFWFLILEGGVIMASSRISRKQTLGEEIANSVSHGVGALLSLMGAVPLVVKAALTGSGLRTFALAAYGVSLVLLYTASAVYHAVQNPEVKRVLRIFDHCSIFVLILGTYIPMSLLVVGGRVGWLLFLTNTTLAVIGITLNAIDLTRFDHVSMVLYALMGWLIVVALRSIIAALPGPGLALLVAGGVSYTVGILFYKSQKRYMHFVWHLFVLAGSVLQYLCIALYCV